jgi:hypothetical protein
MKNISVCQKDSTFLLVALDRKRILNIQRYLGNCYHEGRRIKLPASKGIQLRYTHRRHYFTRSSPLSTCRADRSNCIHEFRTNKHLQNPASKRIVCHWPQVLVPCPENSPTSDHKHWFISVYESSIWTWRLWQLCRLGVQQHGTRSLGGGDGGIMTGVACRWSWGQPCAR